MAIFYSLMVIGYFDVIRVAIDKTETDSPLFIDGLGVSIPIFKEAKRVI